MCGKSALDEDIESAWGDVASQRRFNGWTAEYSVKEGRARCRYRGVDSDLVIRRCHERTKPWRQRSQAERSA